MVQADYYNIRIRNVLLASITGNLSRRKDSAHFFIDASTIAGQRSGLSRDSLVSCLNLTVHPQDAIGPKIGELSDRAMQRIDECLKVALGIA